MTETSTEFESRPGNARWFIAALVVAGGVVPLVAYGWWSALIASVIPAAAREQLQSQDQVADVLLIDVRPEQTYGEGHIDGAVHWPLEDILAVKSQAGIPERFRCKTLLLVCDTGLVSRWAAWHLAVQGVSGASSVRGGIQEWIRCNANDQPFRRPPADGRILPWLEQSPVPDGGAFDRWRLADGRVVPFPFRRSPVTEQAAAVIAYFFIKPIYMLLAVGIAAALWSRRSPDLVAVRWATVAFFLGEGACAVNYFVFRESSYLWEYLHCYGMLVCFAFATYAVLEGADRRLIHLTDPARRCAALALCVDCIKHGDHPCGLTRLFYLIIPVLLTVSLMLPMADWQDTSYNTLVFGQVYNYAHLRVHQQVENWYCAAGAIVMFATSLAILAWKRENAVGVAKITFSAGAGALGFGMFRMVLGGAYDQNRVWYLWWEEITELLFVVAVAVVLWVFRRSLLPQRDTGADAT
ncbi:MAG: rhodanese-like domain-containing protein [Pirellulales bacterium]